MAREADSKEVAVQKHAAGFVLYRREADGPRYLLLRNAKHGDLGLPKGHRDNGDADDLATAMRETEEETGLRPTPNTWFRRTVRYDVKGRLKEVVYFVASTDAAEVRLSREHDWCSWLDLDSVLAHVHHYNLREVMHAAGTFLKDPSLRRGLTPSAARALLIQRVGADAPVVAHTTEVAAMARAMAEAWNGVDPDYVEAAAWLHDIGRSVAHDTRHTVEGFDLLVAEGWPGYAPASLSHYAKGRPHDECGPLADELWRRCDLDTFELEERIIALADFLAAGPRRVRIEERHADLCERYGASPFLDGSLARSRAILEEFERRTGQNVYEVARVG